MNQCLTAPLYAADVSHHYTGARLPCSMPLHHVCSPARLVTLPRLSNQAFLRVHIDICGGHGECVL